MKPAFRWYGESDKIKLRYIKQIPEVRNIVTAVYDISVGEVWTIEKIENLKEKIVKENLKFEVIESVPVHESIKLGLDDRDYYIENYKKTIENLSKAGIKVICYNFMPIVDWTRTQINKELEDGSKTLVYYEDDIKNLNILKNDFALPGWDISYSKDDIKNLLEKYKILGKEGLWKNLEYFLKKIIPVAEKCGVKMAIHPDDPPWDIFGLPRIITNEENIDRFLRIIDSPSHGLTFCTGSLGSLETNNILKMIDVYSKNKKIFFMHVRNIKRTNKKSFEETAHCSSYGSLDIVEIMKILYKNKYEGYLRPDHGRMIWDEEGRPGYGLYDRALGISYINGIWETLSKI